MSALRSIAFWSAFPFLIPQALNVKKSAPQLMDAKGGDLGFIGNGKKLKVLGLGDSIIAGVGTRHIKHSWLGQTVKKLYENHGLSVEWKKVSKTGAKTTEIIKLFSNHEGVKFDVVILSLGVNDVTGLVLVHSWISQVKELINLIHTKSPNAKLFFSGLPPMHEFPLLPQPLRWALGLRAKTFDIALQTTLRGIDDVMHLPIKFKASTNSFSEDGYHPSEYACAIWGESTAELISAKL